MTRDDFRRRADLVRGIPLEVVLRSWGAVRDPRDKSRWQTRRGPLSVTGTKFFNWHASRGGGGAIDLVMQLGGWDARKAMDWLWRHYGDGQVAVNDSAATPRSISGRQLSLPPSCSAHLERVRQYLRQRRRLSEQILSSLIEDGTLYADSRGNAVFLMVAGKPNRPIGAELRGTGSRVWRGLAPGTRRDAGYFWIGNTSSKRIVLCESAIDAISCFQLQPCGACICISTAGVRATAPWLYPLLNRGYQIYCGFDADEAGERASCRMIARHPSVQRLHPPQHDWNETLTAKK